MASPIAPIDPELVRKVLTAPLMTPRVRWWAVAPSPYKCIDVFHFDDCPCDECGAYRRVGIG